ncbi:hypothetical protein [Gimibacter soli]|uniref:Uncharacterized protein n=1 Tax=Gimibacter soli TaxID=3024400 RepID=A0AAE9XKF9_9PROT|nr:hypothetical protein [Gimibacter soli]WCL52572.1 hypothetical protein PH603_08435 [Gimibacter soli]
MSIVYTDAQLALQGRLEAANINPASFLATDYLNHYNEIVMLLEMLPDMPDMIEDCDDWAPKSYVQHFEDSGFTAKKLAIEAYGIAPDVIRKPFEAICAKLDKLIVGTVAGLHKVGAAERGLTGDAAALIKARIEQVQGMLMTLNQLIHGKLEGVKAATKAEIVDHAEEEAAQTQADIDKLFD